METFAKNLEKETAKQLLVVERKSSGVIGESHDAILLLENAFVRLKAFVSDYTFKNEPEEIRFFRETKPKLLSKLIYYRKLHQLESNRPPGSNELQEAHLKKEMETIDGFFVRNSEFFRYYRSGTDFLDRYYFLRESFRHEPDIEYFYMEREPWFSTNCDLKVAIILAYEKLQPYLRSELNKLKELQQAVRVPDFSKRQHTWTANKIDLVELIYALSATSGIDYGKSSISEMTRYAEAVFNIDLSNVGRCYYEICLRSHQTRFLDKLKEALINRIDNTNRSGQGA